MQENTLPYLQELANSDKVNMLRKSEHVKGQTKMVLEYLVRHQDELDIVIELPHMSYVAELEHDLGTFKERIRHYEGTQLPE